MSAVASRPALAGARVLSVDDNEGNRYLRRRVLENAGFRVEEAETGHGALALAAIGPDLVLLDVNLPDISGTEVCRRLRADPATSAIPVVQVSATSVASADRTEGLDSGADAYLTEPVEASELVAVVRALLRSHRAEAELRALQERTAEALRLRDEFLAVAAHELLTPLTGARMRVQRSHMIAREPEVADHLQKAIASIDAAARLISQLLDFSSTRSGIELALEEVDVGALVRESVAEVAAIADAAPPIDVRISSPPPRAMADPVRLLEVVRNLVANAIRYGEGSPVAVEVTAEPGHARIAVRDSGPGIAQENVARIFDPYVRLGGSAGRKGLGLGLAIVRSIVEGHGGRVTVESAPGAGASFVVDLPVAAGVVGAP